MSTFPFHSNSRPAWLVGMLKRHWGVPILLIPLCIIAGGILAIGIASQKPKVYSSETILQVSPHRLQDDFSVNMDAGQRSLQTECEIIKSRGVIEKAVNALSLTERWGVEPNTAIQQVSQVIQAEPIHGTDLITINATDTEAVIAKDLANAVAEAYKSYRTELEAGPINERLKQLAMAVHAQEDKVEEARQTVLHTITAAENATPDQGAYREAKRVFEDESEMLHTLKLKQVAKTIQSKIPNKSVHIHSAAYMAEFPIGPNVLRYAITGTVLGLIAGPILSLIVMIVLNSLRAEPGR